MYCTRCGGAMAAGSGACPACGAPCLLDLPKPVEVSADASFGFRSAAASTGVAPGPNVDESTRLLCIGAHLDRSFSDTAIREYLTQPLRSSPPSLGVDPRAVLRECLAARRRRRIRDLVLAALMLAFICWNTSSIVSWILFAAAWRRFGPQRRRLDNSPRIPGRAASAFGWVGAALVVLGVLSTLVLIRLLSYANQISGMGRPGSSPFQQTPAQLPSGDDLLGNALVSLLIPLAMLIVLWVDRHVVWKTVTGRLRQGRFSAAVPPPATGMGGLLASPGDGSQAQLLANQPTPAYANCVVYRGPRPFVGSGWVFRPWSVAIHLETPSPGTGPLNGSGSGSGNGTATGGASLSILELHEAVTRDVMRLGYEQSLSPSRRLAGVRAEGKVFVPAASMLQHVGGHELREIFPDRNRRPAPVVSDAFLQWIAESPREWLRYYGAYVVEAWDREIIVSLLLHFGLDDRNLYIDCIPCFLPPVDPRYRYPDTLSDVDGLPAFLDALGSWTVLPLNILGRLRTALSRTAARPTSPDDPARYGSAITLRELAAADDVTDEMQASDLNRYLQILETRITRAIGCYLESRGVSVVDFMDQAKQAISNNYYTYQQYSYGPNYGNANYGGGGTFHLGQSSAAPGRAGRQPQGSRGGT